uniref:Ras interacting protein 1 n=1 Tax=Loxodonta africana TaxID=9785 RepID=G3UKZ7_LOXAF
MLSGERKEGGSPRFGKLHLPVGLWINSPRKQLAKLGRRWPSAASVKSLLPSSGPLASLSLGLYTPPSIPAHPLPGLGDRDHGVRRHGRPGDSGGCAALGQREEAARAVSGCGPRACVGCPRHGAPGGPQDLRRRAGVGRQLQERAGHCALHGARAGGRGAGALRAGRQPQRWARREQLRGLLRALRREGGGAGKKPIGSPAGVRHGALLARGYSRSLLTSFLFPSLSKVVELVGQAAWEKIKEIGDRQPENHPEGVPEVPLTPEAVSVELRPLMLWMANTTELLSFVQEKVLEMEKEADQEVQALSSDPQLCNDLELCDEAMALLDEVIMCTFQQSVYYLTKTLYSTLPALLDSNPFTAGAELPGPGAELGAMPPGLRPTLGVFQAALELTSQCELHPDLVSQTFGYLFFFSNASLLNSLMERGQGRPFYQWSRAVQIRTNLDLVLDWLQGAGLGDIATEFFRKLSMAVNLLCVPRTSLLKASWSSLRTDHPTLTPAQLHHLLSHYQLGPGRGPPPAWDPPTAERDAVDTGDIFESFSSHPPLILPLGSSRLRLTGPVMDDA